MATIAEILDGDGEVDYAARLPYLEKARALLFSNYNAAGSLVRLVRHLRHNQESDADLLAKIYLNH